MTGFPRQRLNDAGKSERSAQKSLAAANALTKVAYGDGELLPFASRANGLSMARLFIFISVSVGAVFESADLTNIYWLGGISYVIATSGLSIIIGRLRQRQAAIAVLGLLLCLDGVGLQVCLHQLGLTVVTIVALGIFLVGVCLLGSFRTGLKIGLWQSILIAVDDRGTETGLFSHAASSVSSASLITMLWALLLFVCFAASISERELRRRRRDAELLREFAVSLLSDDDVNHVARRSVEFIRAELRGSRTIVCTREAQDFRIIVSHGIDVDVKAPSGNSLLLDLALIRPALARRLKAAHDPWLAVQMPQARRVVAVVLGHLDGDQPVWLVFEHRAQGIRLENRALTTIGQLAASTALAMSRALLYEQAQRHASTDGLTNLANRRTFDTQFTALTEKMPTNTGAVILVDVDHFKSVNDTYGHQIGDEVLQAVARTLAITAPWGSLVARYGGEEFVVLLPLGDKNSSLLLAEELRAAVERIVTPVQVTASFGVGLLSQHASANDCLAAADTGLYEAKNGGRNQVRLPSGYSANVP